MSINDGTMSEQLTGFPRTQIASPPPGWPFFLMAHDGSQVSNCTNHPQNPKIIPNHVTSDRISGFAKVSGIPATVTTVTTSPSSPSLPRSSLSTTETGPLGATLEAAMRHRDVTQRATQDAKICFNLSGSVVKNNGNHRKLMGKSWENAKKMGCLVFHWVQRRIDTRL